MQIIENIIAPSHTCYKRVKSIYVNHLKKFADAIQEKNKLIEEYILYENNIEKILMIIEEQYTLKKKNNNKKQKKRRKKANVQSTQNKIKQNNSIINHIQKIREIIKKDNYSYEDINNITMQFISEKENVQSSLAKNNTKISVDKIISKINKITLAINQISKIDMYIKILKTNTLWHNWYSLKLLTQQDWLMIEDNIEKDLDSVIQTFNIDDTNKEQSKFVLNDILLSYKKLIPYITNLLDIKNNKTWYDSILLIRLNNGYTFDDIQNRDILLIKNSKLNPQYYEQIIKIYRKNFEPLSQALFNHKQLVEEYIKRENNIGILIAKIFFISDVNSIREKLSNIAEKNTMSGILAEYALAVLNNIDNKDACNIAAKKIKKFTTAETEITKQYGIRLETIEIYRSIIANNSSLINITNTNDPDDTNLNNDINSSNNLEDRSIGNAIEIKNDISENNRDTIINQDHDKLSTNNSSLINITNTNDPDDTNLNNDINSSNNLGDSPIEDAKNKIIKKSKNSSKYQSNLNHAKIGFIVPFSLIISLAAVTTYFLHQGTLKIPNEIQKIFASLLKKFTFA